ncbi:hypothetical protein OMR07_10295, partial [Methylobacterium organophilum]|nr:hypothetical protein [Methylobacterium organophilum]
MPQDGSDPRAPAPPRKRARGLRAALGAAALGLGLLGAGAVALWRYAEALPPLDLAGAESRSTVVLDRSGSNALQRRAVPDPDESAGSPRLPGPAGRRHGLKPRAIELQRFG